MTERMLRHLKSDGIDPDRVENVCREMFEILDARNFTLKETYFALSSMKSILGLMTKDDPLRKVSEFDYCSSIKEQLSLEASSNTAS